MVKIMLLTHQMSLLSAQIHNLQSKLHLLLQRYQLRDYESDSYNEYNKLLKTRNEYLKILFNNSIADQTYLDIITDKLIEKAVLIYQKRKEYIFNWRNFRYRWPLWGL